LTNQPKNTLSNLKTIHQLHTNGDVLSFLRQVRESMSFVDEFSNKMNDKINKQKTAVEEKQTSQEVREIQKEIQVEKPIEKPVETSVKTEAKPAEAPKVKEEQPKKEEAPKTEPKPAPKQVVPEISAEEKARLEEIRKLEERRLFHEEIQNLVQKKPSRPNFSQPQKQTFDKKKQQQNNQQQSVRPNRPQNDRQNNRPNQNIGQNGKPNQNNAQNKKPFDKKPQANASQDRKQTGSQTFASTKANAFKNFAAPAPSSLQNDRGFGGKNKNNFRNFDDRKNQGKQRNGQRRGFIDLDDNNEERVTIRKLAKPKKKGEVHVATPVTSAVITTENVSVKVLSEKIGKPVSDIIKQLMLLGMMATINSTIDFATAELVAGELGITLEQKIEQTYEEKLFETTSEEVDAEAIKRPPVVTVMGHVDHGKTSLLDAIRKTNVAKAEAGGITQKIGAYMIETNGEKVTFIDTPGHAAFTAMRARGAKVTDIAILVVAADDGIMPQTIEAINHIKAAEVPMIVAVNKMDTVDANIERVKSQLAENGVMPEEWGGDAIVVPISAKTGVGIDKIIENILLVAEIEELKANPNKMATGTVIEAELDKNRGPIATVLVQSGTLRVGDSIMSGLSFGKVRAMFNENGKQVKEATPSMPVAVMGFYEVPNSGDQVFAVDEKLSKNVIAERKNKIKEEQAKKTSGVSLDDFMDRVNEGKLKSLNIIIKADTQGSVEALKSTLTAIRNEEVKVSCIHSAPGNVTESDLVLAQASSAIIINFNIKVLPKIQNQADKMKVEIKQYNVIYDIVEDITNAISGMMTVKYEQVVTGHAEVRVVFKLSTNGLVAGSYVTDGKIIRSGMARLIRDGEIIADTNIAALKIVKDDKAEIQTGFECGIKLADIPNLKEGDIIECYENVPIKR